MKLTHHRNTFTQSRLNLLQQSQTDSHYHSNTITGYSEYSTEHQNHHNSDQLNKLCNREVIEITYVLSIDQTTVRKNNSLQLKSIDSGLKKESKTSWTKNLSEELQESRRKLTYNFDNPKSDAVTELYTLLPLQLL